jgi:hypothetical protein
MVDGPITDRQSAYEAEARRLGKDVANLTSQQKRIATRRYGVGASGHTLSQSAHLAMDTMRRVPASSGVVGSRPTSRPPVDRRLTRRSASNVWEEIQAKCREMQASGELLVISGRVGTRVTAVLSTRIQLADGTEARRSGIEGIWGNLSSTVGRSGGRAADQALVVLIDGVQVDGDALILADPRKAGRLYQARAAVQSPRAPWSYEELVLALDLYVRRGLLSDADPEVVELSRLLNAPVGAGVQSAGDRYRNVAGIKMKLANFRAVERPGHGLSHSNRLEQVVWDRFQDEPQLLRQEARAIAVELSRREPEAEKGGTPSIGFLSPFVPKADLTYTVEIAGGIQPRTRSHETLVNSFADYLTARGFKPLRNRAVDLGLQEPPVIVEAKTVKRWAIAIREAVGQLYEYKYFQVVPPEARLVILTTKPIPELWRPYIENDRGIGMAWPEAGGFFVSERAQAAFGPRIVTVPTG